MTDWVVHVDDAIVAVDKPAGLLSVPGRGADKQDCAWTRVRCCWPEAEVVHRLDMATSGLLVFARGAVVQRRLQAAFAERRVDKCYVAVVHGLPEEDNGSIALPLVADWPRRPRQKVDATRGRPSLTHWRVVSRDSAAALTRLELQPVTGRSHQLRVHLLAAGWPIVGDTLYGAQETASLAPRLMLHASTLAFEHPLSGRPMRLRCAPPF